MGLSLLRSLVCLISCWDAAADTINADIVFVANSWLLRRGLRLRRGTDLFTLPRCWLHEDPFLYRIYAYDHCCCDPWEKSHRCWTDIDGMRPRATKRHHCCVYTYGPGTFCMNREHVQLSYPGLPLIKARLHPSDYPWKSFFPNLLTEADLLQPLHGRDGAPGPVLRVADLGAGKGIDSIALSLMGHRVVSLELDRLELQLLKANRMLNNVSFEIVAGDFTLTNQTAEALLGANEGLPFDVIVANYLLHLPSEQVLFFLDLVDRVGARDFLWLCPCGQEVYDLYDYQAVNREHAFARFELVDAVTFVKMGNGFEPEVQLGQTRICALQRRRPASNAWRYRWPRAFANAVLRPGPDCIPPLWRCSPDHFISM